VQTDRAPIPTTLLQRPYTLRKPPGKTIKIALLRSRTPQTPSQTARANSRSNTIQLHFRTPIKPPRRHQDHLLGNQPFHLHITPIYWDPFPRNVRPTHTPYVRSEPHQFRTLHPGITIFHTSVTRRGRIIYIERDTFTTQTTEPSNPRTNHPFYEPPQLFSSFPYIELHTNTPGSEPPTPLGGNQQTFPRSHDDGPGRDHVTTAPNQPLPTLRTI
jgi:hypothetical protein